VVGYPVSQLDAADGFASARIVFLTRGRADWLSRTVLVRPTTPMAEPAMLAGR
jgi:hypothetical protein